MSPRSRADWLRTAGHCLVWIALLSTVSGLEAEVVGSELERLAPVRIGALRTDPLAGDSATVNLSTVIPLAFIPLTTPLALSSLPTKPFNAQAVPTVVPDTNTETGQIDTAASGPQPRSALWRSALLPGWGQVYNGKIVKAVFFGGATVGLSIVALNAARQVSRAPTPEIHQERAARRNTRILYVALASTLAALDAYVDAHLADLEVVPLAGVTGLSLRVSLGRR
jgi:hypothetical protein